MRDAGVPVVPGCDLVSTVAEGQREGARIGYPLLIKARSGGGGKGIRLVESADDLEHSFCCFRRSLASFRRWQYLYGKISFSGKTCGDADVGR